MVLRLRVVLGDDFGDSEDTWGDFGGFGRYLAVILRLLVVLNDGFTVGFS